MFYLYMMAASINTMVKFGDWQVFLGQSLIEHPREKLEATFMNAKTNFERMVYMSNTELLSTTWLTQYFNAANVDHKRYKRSEMAIELRQKGNEAFQRKEYRESIHHYNECILWAPDIKDDDESSVLAIGFANRSAALLRLGHYQACVEDVGQALRCNYPSKLRYKVLQRRGHCFRALRDKEKAKSAYEEAKGSLSYLDDKKRALVSQELDGDIRKLDTSTSGAAVTLSDSAEVTPLPTPVHGVGHVMTQASQALDLKHSPEKGRHLVANRAIKEGDVLIVEKPFAAVLLPTHYHSHCHHCFGRLFTVIPCVQCPAVRYCSVACRDASWMSYHSVECPYLDLLHSVGVAHLSLRTVLVAGLTTLLGYQGDETTGVEPGPGRGGRDEEGVYTWSYRTVYHLLPHTDKMAVEDLFQYSLTAALLLRVLQNGGFFKTVEQESADIGDLYHHVGALLLRHICQLVCNANAVTEVAVTGVTSASHVETHSQSRVATAIYPTSSLMNHSCDPTVISSFHKSCLVVRAVKNVEPGEEVLNCYGPHCGRMGRHERQEILRDQYFFTCVCSACSSPDAREDAWQAFRCPTCDGPLCVTASDAASGRCLECGHVASLANQEAELRRSKEDFDLGLKKLEAEDFQGAESAFRKCVTLRRAVLYRHNRQLAEARDALARCYASQGRYAEAAQWVSEGVQTTAEVYGQSSVELAYELQKYAEVLVNAGHVPEALDAATRGRDILRRHYGESHPSTRDLETLRGVLQRVSLESSS